MQTTWTFEHGRIWATCADGRRIATWEAEPAFGYRFCRIRERRRVNRVNCGARTQDESICSTSKGCVFLST